MIIVGKPKFHLGQFVTFNVHGHSPLITCTQHHRETGRECERTGEINMITLWRREETYGYRIVDGKQWHWVAEREISVIADKKPQIKASTFVHLGQRDFNQQEPTSMAYKED